ncbi:ZGRF1, partial [Symbiodinium sp. KB8]
MSVACRHECLYTHQKAKKRKVWQDGFVQVDAQRRLTLLDVNDKVLGSLLLSHTQADALEGAELETDRFLVMVE